MTDLQRRAQQLKIDLNTKVTFDIKGTGETSALKWIEMIQNFLKVHDLTDAEIDIDCPYEYTAEVCLVANVPKTDAQLKLEITERERHIEQQAQKERLEYERLRKKYGQGD